MLETYPKCVVIKCQSAFVFVCLCVGGCAFVCVCESVCVWVCVWVFEWTQSFIQSFTTLLCILPSNEQIILSATKRTNLPWVPSTSLLVWLSPFQSLSFCRSYWDLFYLFVFLAWQTADTSPRAVSSPGVGFRGEGFFRYVTAIPFATLHSSSCCCNATPWVNFGNFEFLTRTKIAILVTLF